MVAIKLSAFGGQIPAQDDRLLPQNNAALAENTFLDSGALQGMRTPRLLHTMAHSGYQYAFRIPNSTPDKNHIFNSTWWEFSDPDTNVVRSPVANDSYSRYYFASAGQAPGYNTQSRIIAGSANFLLGIPTPETAPGVSVTGGSATNETRSYVYTWVSTYGEEGAPSPPTTVTNHPDGTWNLTLTSPLAGDSANRSLATQRIYRTVPGVGGSATFFWVADVPIGTTTYADNQSDAVVSLNNQLTSTTYTPPPSGLKGIVSMPNGMIAGWQGNEVWFCEPYLPHAWPAAYTIAVDATIVGLGVVGQTLVILTDGFPYAATGVSPSTMALSKIATYEPCMSRGGIISTQNGVLYPSPNGICLAAYGLVQNATQQLATKDRWQDLIQPETIRAARIGSSYYAWGSPGAGCFDPVGYDTSSFQQEDYTSAFSGILVSLVDPRIAWTSLETADTTQASITENVLTDVWTGEVFLVRNNQVLWLDTTTQAVPGSYLWRSKVFELDEPKNLAAMKIRFEENTYDPSFVLSTSAPNRNINQTLAANQYGLVRVYAGGQLILCYELRTTGELMRLPSGFKHEFWQFEIEARVKVYNIQVASSAKELAKV